jgi:hypothetical protein
MKKSPKKSTFTYPEQCIKRFDFAEMDRGGVKPNKGLPFLR